MIAGPGWLAPLVASVFIVVALYCATSLVLRGRRWTRASAADANHVLMAGAMAAMALPAGASLVPAGVETGVFGLAAVGWLVALLVPGGRGAGVDCGAHPAHLVVLNGAMVAMDVAMRPAPGAMSGMPAMDGMGAHGPAALAPGLVVVTIGLAVYLAGHAAVGVSTVGTAGAGAAGVGGTAPAGGLLRRATTSPVARNTCQVVMSLGMAGMLLLLL